MQTFEELHKCRGGKLVYNDEQAKRYGNINSSLINTECTKCKKKVHLQTSANPGGNWKVQNAVDINRRMVFLPVKWELDVRRLQLCVTF